jgi:hypothetical protein
MGRAVSSLISTSGAMRKFNKKSVELFKLIFTNFFSPTVQGTSVSLGPSPVVLSIFQKKYPLHARIEAKIFKSLNPLARIHAQSLPSLRLGSRHRGANEGQFLQRFKNLIFNCASNIF